VAFDSAVRSWRPSVVDVSEANLRHAWMWIKQLTCQGTTNTMEALQLAFRDDEIKAAYLLTDGRPDQVRLVPSWLFSLGCQFQCK